MNDEVKKDEVVDETAKEIVKDVETPSNVTKTTENNNNEGESKTKTYTQEQLDKILSKEKDQSRQSVYKEIGINDKDDKQLKMFKAFIESQKTDEQKAAESKTEEDAKLKEIERRALIAEAKAEAMTLGVKSQYVDDVVTLALAKTSDNVDFKSVISEYKTKYAIWFTDGEESNQTGKKGTGSSIKTTKKEAAKDKGIGSRLAAQRKGNNKKFSYWKKK